MMLALRGQIVLKLCFQKLILARCVAGMQEKRDVQGVVVRKPEKQRPLWRCRWKHNIKMDVKEMGGWCGLDGSGTGQGQVVGCCEHVHEPSGFTKCWEFLDQLRNCWLLKKDSAPWRWVLTAVLTCIILGTVK